jgi:hypothetical protein
VREYLRDEKCDESQWWHSCTAKDDSLWRGRMIILATYNKDGTPYDTRADYWEFGGEWRAVWGWSGSRVKLPPP